MTEPLQTLSLRKGLLNLCYGNAFLSRHPIVATETIVFGQRSVGEKGFLFAEFDRLVSGENGRPRWHMIGQIQRNKAKNVATSSSRRRGSA